MQDERKQEEREVQQNAKEVSTKNDQRKKGVRREVEMLKYLVDMAGSLNIHCFNGKLERAKPEAITMSAALFYKVFGGEISEKLIGAYESVKGTEEYEADYYKAVVVLERSLTNSGAKQFICNLQECCENPIAC